MYNYTQDKCRYINLDASFQFRVAIKLVVDMKDGTCTCSSANSAIMYTCGVYNGVL